MTPATRAALGLVPLPPEQAARIEAQARELAAGRFARWPAGMASTRHTQPTSAWPFQLPHDDDRPASGFAFDITPQP